MRFDQTTLMVASSLTTGLSGLLLLGAWFQVRNAPALLWWSIANLLYAAGMLILHLAAPVSQPLALPGVMLITIAPALVWAGVRRFEGHRISPAILGAGVALWLVVEFGTRHDAPSTASIVVGLGNWVVYLVAAVAELWHGRRERLAARWPLMALLLVHGGVHFLGILDALDGEFAAGVPSLDGLFGAIYFEGLLYAMGSAIFMVVMCIQRNEAGFSRAAQYDALTGAVNRGAFFELAERLCARCRTEASPFSVILFDLDRFKTINDSFGHQVGDRVIQAFADAARRTLRSNDLFGRYGGEEFVAFLPGATTEVAEVIADRVRSAFHANAVIVDGRAVAATVSGGVADSSAGPLDEAIRIADEALYRAKALGRNRVHAASVRSAGEDLRVVRVA